MRSNPPGRIVRDNHGTSRSAAKLVAVSIAGTRSLGLDHWDPIIGSQSPDPSKTQSSASGSFFSVITSHSPDSLLVALSSM